MRPFHGTPKVRGALTGADPKDFDFKPALAALVAILLLASSTFMMRGVLRAPASLLQDAYDGTADVSQWEAIGRSDQEMVVALVARNADLFTSNPGGLQGYGQCFPF